LFLWGKNPLLHANSPSPFQREGDKGGEVNKYKQMLEIGIVTLTLSVVVMKLRQMLE